MGSFGSGGPECGRPGGRPSSAGLPPRCCAGSDAAFAATGPRSPGAARRATRPSTPRSKPWSEGWPRPIPCGVLPESMANSSSSASTSLSKLLSKRRSPPSQTWRTFLTNHVRDLVSIDFFTVPTARLRVLFVFVVLAHDRRRVLHFNVTEHPTAAWTAQQLVDAFPDDSAPSCLLRDRD